MFQSVTQLLSDWRKGDEAAFNELMLLFMTNCINWRSVTCRGNDQGIPGKRRRWSMKPGCDWLGKTKEIGRIGHRSKTAIPPPEMTSQFTRTPPTCFREGNRGRYYPSKQSLRLALQGAACP
jgi:hypothetical protein